MSRFLTILEVSRKQAYIFASNRLQDNIRCSAEIAEITGVAYMQEALDRNGTNEKGIRVSERLVYSGGGHTILEFGEKADADYVVKRVTERILKDLPGIEMFASTVRYDDDKTPGENVKELTKALEAKKSFRVASFRQETFGIEKIDPNTGKAERIGRNENTLNLRDDYRPPEGFLAAKRFEDLGGEKGETNFIAVVHIDGNAMGKRVEEIASSCKVGEWDEYKRKMRAFSDGIAKDFLTAYRGMERQVAKAAAEGFWMNSGMLSEIPFRKKGNEIYFPVRKIINEGDDICFVSEGRIGLACAAAFLRELNGLVNDEDGKAYAACAGVALVHLKYPFYRAYELAEELCGNAKRFGVTLGSKVAGMVDGAATGALASGIDWHIEYGEIQDSLEETRRQYESPDGSRLELRPYLLSGPKELLDAEPVRQFRNFEKLMSRIMRHEEFYSSGTLKQLRSVLKRGNNATEEYLRFHKVEELGRDAVLGIYEEADYRRIGTGRGQERKIFLETADGKRRSLLFDAIEMMDTYLPLEAPLFD